MTELTLVIGNKNYSSWSLRPWLAMKRNGLEFKEIRLPMDTSEFYAEIPKYSPSNKVPVLLHGSQKIWESLAILEYLAEEFPDLYWYREDKTAKNYSAFYKRRNTRRF